MNALLALAILATFIYSLLFDTAFLKIYFSLIIVYYILTQTFIVNRKVNSLRKKLCIATWGSPSEPSAYLSIDLDVTKTLEQLKTMNQVSQVKHTMTHVATKALGLGIDKFPQLNGNIAFGNFYPNKRTDISVLVNVEGGTDLVNVNVQDVPNISLESVASKLNVKAKSAKSGQDQAHQKKTGAIPYIPTFLIQPILYATGYISQNLRIPLKPLGMKAHEFGSAVLTNIGTLGIKDGFAPLSPFCNVPAIACLGKITKQAIVVDDEIVIRDIVKLNLTIDHRFSDAAAGVKCFNTVIFQIIQYMKDPLGYIEKQKQQSVESSSADKKND